MKLTMIRTALVLAFLALGTSVSNYARAQGGCVTGGTGGCPAVAAVPEIDPSLAGTGIALLGGTVLLIRTRRRH
jgi:hypothetical protein